MKPDSRFQNQSKEFWANVRTLSQHLGYANSKGIKTFSLAQVCEGLKDLGLSTAHVANADGSATAMGNLLVSYFEFRARTLTDYVEPRLMKVEQAKALYERLKRKLKPKCPQPMNKQKKEKKAPSYLTCIVNMLIEANAGGLSCNYDPGELTTFTKAGAPLRTLARRVDGAFPSVVNPVAIWEIKEYYYTTTFGSRVADGVYETLLDGLELEELKDKTSLEVLHYLIVDDHFTWWSKGRSYLCRLIDLMHMGYADEVIFGREVTDRVPDLVKAWGARVRAAAREPVA